MSFMKVGFLCMDALGQVSHLVLNQDVLLARLLINSVRELLAPLHVVTTLDKT